MLFSKSEQSKAKQIQSMLELKQMPNQVSQEMNVKEIKNILHDFVALENKNHAIKTQKKCNRSVSQ